MNQKLLTCALLLLLAPAGFTPLNAAKSASALSAVNKAFDKPLVKTPTGAPTQTFSVKAFSKVEIGSALQVIIRKGSQPKLAAYGPKELVDRLEIKQANNGLAVTFRNENWSDQTDYEPVVLVIETAQLSEVELAGAVKGVVEQANAN